jgi:uncharacterized protein DUF4388
MKAAFEASGDIREVDLLAAFVRIWREATSGLLRFSRGAASAGFDLADGEVVAEHSSEPRFETAAILVRAGKLDPAALERLSVTPGTDGALAALQAGLLTKREWKWGEKIRAIEILADLLSWPDGTYSFDAQARPVRSDFVLSVPRLLLELFLRSRDRNLIEHQLGPTDVPLQRSSAFEDEFASFGLTADAESVVRLIDGRASAAEISEQAPAEEFAVLKLLAALKTLGLLETETASGKEQAPGLSEEPEVLKKAPEPQSSFDTWSAAKPYVLDERKPGLEEALDLPQIPLPEPEGQEAAEQEQDWDAPEPQVPPLEPREELVEVEPIPTTWTDGSPEAVVDWEPNAAPLDRPLDLGEIPPPAAERRGPRWGPLLAGFFAFLVVAVAATVFLRSRTVAPERPRPAEVRPTAAASTPAAAPALVATSAPTRAPAPAPTSSPVRSAARATAPPVVVRPTRPAPTPTSAPARARAPESGRAAWLERARHDAQRLRSDPKTRYAIQLELVCEVPSLAEAWRHDRPAGSIWLLTVPHGGRECFRVFWGRYGSLEEARRAKGGIPSYFMTSSNHPAVVSVR